MEHPSQIERAAKLAVKEVFYILGVNVDDAKSVEAFREDLRFAGKLRKISNNALMTMIGLLATGIVIALWSGVKHALLGK